MVLGSGFPLGAPLGGNDAQGLGFGDDGRVGDGGRDLPCVQRRCAGLIPAPCACGIHAHTVVCDGTWVGPFTVLVAAGGARNKSGMARDPEARWQPFPVERQQWRGAGDRPSGASVIARASAGSQSFAPGQKSPTRVPQGDPGTRAGSQGARRGSQGGPAPPGPGGTGPRVAARHPRTRRTPGPLPETDGAWAGAEANCTHEYFSNQAFPFGI